MSINSKFVTTENMSIFKYLIDSGFSAVEIDLDKLCSALSSHESITTFDFVMTLLECADNKSIIEYYDTFACRPIS